MKTLILSCNTGQGHNTAGAAIKEELSRRGIQGEMLDALLFAGERTSGAVSGAYTKITTHIPKMFGFMYRVGGVISSNRRRSPVYFANTQYAQALGDYIEENSIDTVVSSHLFPAEALTFLRRKRALKARCYSICTDYTCIPFWEETDFDLLFIPHESLRDEFLARGIDTARMISSGIPVSGRFNRAHNRAEARARLKIGEQERVFLVMTGSMGFGDVPKLVSALNGRVIVLVGRNERLRERVERKCPNAMCVSFTHDVELYMSACDVLLTKPGGLSSTEAAVFNVPLIHTSPIPGCETKNARFFESLHMSESACDARRAAELANALAENEEKKRAMLEAQRRSINPYAAREICDVIL